MQNRRSFMKHSFAGALWLGTAPIIAKTEWVETTNQVITKSPKINHPFQLGMAGYIFANFDLDTTLNTMERIDIHYIKCSFLGVAEPIGYFKALMENNQ